MIKQRKLVVGRYVQQKYMLLYSVGLLGLMNTSAMHGSGLLTACKDTLFAPFTFGRSVITSFAEKIADSKNNDVKSAVERTGTRLGSALGNSIVGIPERMVNGSVDQLCSLAVNSIPWFGIYSVARGYLTIPEGIRPYVYGKKSKKNCADSKIAISQQETDTHFVDRLPLAEQEKNMLRDRFDRIAIGGASARDKESLAVIKGLPWNKYTQDTSDLAHARTLLDESHYGLEPVKRQILNYIAVRQLNPHAPPPVLCLVGPPGVGKTSIARTIARCLNRRHDVIACGTMSEKSRLVGIAPAYVGAHAGLIIKALERTEAMNPVLIFDEIDKMPESAMDAVLGVLDQQNNSFRDHFIDVPCDLSKILPIITANDLKRLPAPLQDRMHIITIDAFAEHEKLAIAQKFLVHKAIQYAGLNMYAAQLEMRLNENVIRHIIKHYTHEAGVRDLDRTLRSLCAEVARVVVEHKYVPEITVDNLAHLLGKPPVY